MRNLLRVLPLLLVLSVALTAGPFSTYYLTDGEGGANWIIRGDAAQSYAQHGSQEYAIAVSGGQVRTLGADPGDHGSLYDTDFNYLGTDYPYFGYGFNDGTSDGAYNYSVDWYTGIVYRTTRDWISPTVLFDTGFGTGNAVGITYDPSNNSLWVSQFSGSTIANFSMTGVPLSSFNVRVSAITALALDPADRTLWFGSQNTMGTFYQYSVSGIAGQTQAYANMTASNTLGGEFDSVPEPASALLFSGVLAALLLYHIGRRRVARANVDRRTRVV